MKSIYYLAAMSLNSHLESVNPVTIIPNKFLNISRKCIFLSKLEGYDTGCLSFTKILTVICTREAA